MENIEVEIKDVGQRGDGIGHVETGEVVFVAGGLVGDVVKISVSKGKDEVLRGNIIEIITSSPNRIKPVCPYYDDCGGCSMQHMTSEFYKKWKETMVREAFERRDIDVGEWKPSVFIRKESRRRVNFAVYVQKNKVTVGYRKKKSHQITNIPECMVLDASIMELRNKMLPYIGKIMKIGKPANLFIQKIGNYFDVVITGAFKTKKGDPDLDVRLDITDMANDLNISRVSWRLKDKGEIELIIQPNEIVARMGMLSVSLPPMAFLQPSLDGENALVSAVMEGLPKKGTFADLFSGSGTFAGRMMERGHVDSFEEDPDAARISKAKRRDLFKNPIKAKELNIYDAVVFDPPRVGAKDQCKEIIMSDVPVVIGVSCNPTSFARDAEILIDGGYELRAVTIVDQFNWTEHVEIVGVFTK